MPPLTEQNQIAVNEQLAFIAELRTAIGSINFINALLSASKKAWDDFSNIETGEHLIQGIAVSPIKTDACNSYVAKIIKLYLDGEASRSTAWTKNTIASDNFTNKSISSIIAAHTFNDHHELLKIVATRLIGFDNTLVDAALAMDDLQRAEHLVVYMASRFDLAPDREAILKRYDFQVGYIMGGLQGGLFQDPWFIAKSQEAIGHYSNEPEEGDMYIYDRFDLLVQE